ncbi:hypothetical protein ONS95_013417 [Cadophora gregata]|uniref:uncharacterized protein n=1 Tax=Cadophora gregata TaxID=51156 RepID=UPI0026DBD886|nr:uncharacterized protein ONS95_013417 [Cadophora gregata]KAK0099690.1 hypothetical protein ONS96_008187 [Cadophora gregata f. sp. sojae]KAK0116397.1 hypothetical protein ONS95_013417 [Cadophora gregata]
MSIVQDLCFGDQHIRRGVQGSHKIHGSRLIASTKLCIDKHWVESSSNQWPPLTESHLNFLIQRFGLCSPLQERITHFSIDAILQATTIYLDKTGWTNRHEDRLWEKLNLKIGYLHAGLTGQRDQAMVDHYCKARLYSHTMHKKNLPTLSLYRNENLQMSPYRQQLPHASSPTFQPTGYTGRTESQYRPEVKSQPVRHAMELWMSLSANEQADLLRSQLRAAKNFNTLAMVVNQQCKTYQASRARRSSHGSPTKTCHPLDINIPNSKTNTHTNALSIRTDISPSSTMTPKAKESASSSGISKSPGIVFDGLPSPTATPLEEPWSATPFSPSHSDKVTSPLHSIDDDIQEINEIDFTENAPESKQAPLTGKSLDVKSTIDQCIRELELKRKREKDTVQEEKEKSDEAKEDAELRQEDEGNMIQSVEDEESEERKKRCKLQVEI